MPSLTQAPYGSWRSPIDGETVARDRGWGYSMLNVDAGAVYWSEARPLEGGRDVIVARFPGRAPADVIGPGYSARTRVHEYGGGALTVHAGVAYFCNDADQRIHRVEPGGEPVPITPEGSSPFALRYADLRVYGDTLVCVREREAAPEHVNELVTLPTDGSAGPRVIASGRDFYAAPRVSPDGTQLAWLVWDHPRMPWEGCELWVSALDGSDARRVAGGPQEAIVQPAWSPDGVLHFSSDRDNWWNLYRVGDAGVEQLTSLDGEIGGPMWAFGQSWYAFVDDGRILCTFSRDGRDNLAVVELDGTLRALDCELTSIADVVADGERCVLVGATPTSSPRVLAVGLDGQVLEALSEDEEEDVDPAYVSVPRSFDYPTTGGATAHALFYPPHNPDFEAPEGERPPLLVHIHGGPTAHVTPRLGAGVQFWTTRGFAVVDVNYGGSTGYGRSYRERLHGTWGVVDTDDAVNAARALAEAGEVDGARMAITGGSAGGWTVLCALAFHDLFAAGADHFGVADLSGFMDDTHKFESRYNDWLVGPLPEAEALWHERSPINHADEIRAPVIVLQGLEDRVVPPSQSEAIVAALARNGVPHAYLTFAGEQHGFRRAETVRRVMDAQLSFYAQVLGFEPADAVEPVELMR